MLDMSLNTVNPVIGQQLSMSVGRVEKTSESVSVSAQLAISSYIYSSLPALSDSEIKGVEELHWCFTLNLFE